MSGHCPERLSGQGKPFLVDGCLIAVGGHVGQRSLTQYRGATSAHRLTKVDEGVSLLDR